MNVSKDFELSIVSERSLDIFLYICSYSMSSHDLNIQMCLNVFWTFLSAPVLGIVLDVESSKSLLIIIFSQLLTYSCLVIDVIGHSPLYFDDI